MEIKVTKTHRITFFVELFQEHEGGMHHEYYGGEMETLEEAISKLELAKQHDKSDWIITANVTTTSVAKGNHTCPTTFADQ